MGRKAGVHHCIDSRTSGILFLVDIFELLDGSGLVVGWRGWRDAVDGPASRANAASGLQTHVRTLRSQAGDLLDELDHFTALDCAGSVLVELTEALVEVIVVEAGAVSHVGESVLDKALGLLLVKITIVVVVVLGPDFVHALANHVIDLSCRLILLFTITFNCRVRVLGSGSFYSSYRLASS